MPCVRETPTKGVRRGRTLALEEPARSIRRWLWRWLRVRRLRTHRSIGLRHSGQRGTAGTAVPQWHSVVRSGAVPTAGERANLKLRGLLLRSIRYPTVATAVEGTNL